MLTSVVSGLLENFSALSGPWLMNVCESQGLARVSHWMATYRWVQMWHWSGKQAGKQASNRDGNGSPRPA